jgi:hypothetical protein
MVADHQGGGHQSGLTAGGPGATFHRFAVALPVLSDKWGSGQTGRNTRSGRGHSRHSEALRS